MNAKVECKGEITKLKAEVAEKQGKLDAMVAENQRLKQLLMKVETFRTEKAKRGGESGGNGT